MQFVQLCLWSSCCRWNLHLVWWAPDFDLCSYPDTFPWTFPSTQVFTPKPFTHPFLWHSLALCIEVLKHKAENQLQLDINTCYQKSAFVLRVIWGDTEQFKILWCVCETINVRAITCTSVYIYIRKTLKLCHLPKETLAREESRKLCEICLALADGFWEHFDLQWRVGVWNCKQALFTFSTIIIEWLLMTCYSKLKNV